MLKKFGIATRFYGLSKGDVKRLVAWLHAAFALVPPQNIFVAINAEEDKSQSLRFLQKNYPKVQAFAVSPWGKVVQAPNALLIKAACRELEYLLFTSTEYPVTVSAIELLRKHFDQKTLVVGLSLAGHELRAQGSQKVIVKRATGLQIPWNTYALWSIERLVHTGFVLAADSLHDPDNAGMEEMGTIAAQQLLWPGRALAKLVYPRENDLIINTYGWNIKRHNRYLRNLRSKNARSAVQLQRLRLPAPEVWHVGLAQ